MLRDLTYFGNPVLRKKCEQVHEITDEIRRLGQDLMETVLAMDGAGLSAPQVGELYRIFVICYANGQDSEGWPIICPPCVFINPILSSPSTEMITHGEGCMSIPGIYEKVTRPRTIEVEYMDLEGKMHKEIATDWRARAVMHENDHLNGVLNIDRIHPKRKKKIEGALRDIKKKYN
ncbi:peptide deformylase [Simkania sp.]|uniref:peptide deformylase n=1 Tax=Simkania sp. TaxID=34094 RepID=UPI003B524CAE